MLLIYGASGELRDAIRLAPERAIARLAFDDDETIWALGHHSGDVDPSAVPMIYRYDQRGNLLGQFVARTEFAADAEFTQEGAAAGGAIGFGVTDESVWFWLPASRHLGVLRKDGSHFAKYDTGLPSQPVGKGVATSSGRVATEVVGTALVPPVRLLAQAVTRSRSGAPAVHLYAWTPSSGWRPLRQRDIEAGRARLVTGDRRGLVLRYPSVKAGAFQLGRADIPTM